MEPTARRRSRRYAVFLCTAFAFAPWGLAAAVDLAKCGRCHATPPIVAPAGPACASCHSAEQDLAHAASVVAEPAAGPEETPAGTAARAVRPAPDSTELLAGMSVPLYYEHTRIGTHPNEMAHIPAGRFTMGTDDRLPDEGPAHIVDLPAYDIDVYEVTNGQYKTFMEATGHRSPPQFENRTYPPGKIDHPVVGVTWNDASDYCTWAANACRATRSGRRPRAAPMHAATPGATSSACIARTRRCTGIRSGARAIPAQSAPSPTGRTPSGSTTCRAMCGNGPDPGTAHIRATRTRMKITANSTRH
ncbi:MAG: formylglycine-generating enzyme family protein [Gammaproteobacteria bacterium]|nr:formylglycine-generating enzyme family protein [Gammaproteobacteria bacterium]